VDQGYYRSPNGKTPNGLRVRARVKPGISATVRVEPGISATIRVGPPPGLAEGHQREIECDSCIEPPIRAKRGYRTIDASEALSLG
jgi:hypothetical protein